MYFLAIFEHPTSLLPEYNIYLTKLLWVIKGTRQRDLFASNFWL
jgi:hypothetical protein